MNPKLLAIAVIVPHLTLHSPAAVLTVTSLADSGPGTLRDAVLASAPADIIEFGTSGVIVLSSSITISKSIWIKCFLVSRLCFAADRAVPPR